MDQAPSIRLANGLNVIQSKLGSLCTMFYKDMVTNSNTVQPSGRPTPELCPGLGLGLISKFAQGKAAPDLLIAMKSAFSTFRRALDDTSTALNLGELPDIVTKTKKPSYHPSKCADASLTDKACQAIEKPQLQDESCDVNRKKAWADLLKAVESKQKLELRTQEEKHNSEIDRLRHESKTKTIRLTRDHTTELHRNYEVIERLTVDLKETEVLLKDNTLIVKELQLRNRILEEDMSHSFMEKLDLENRLSSAEKIIANGKFYCQRRQTEWQRDTARLKEMTLLFEADSANAGYIQLLQKQEALVENNLWLSDQIRMTLENSRLYASEDEAALKRAVQYINKMQDLVGHLDDRLSQAENELSASDSACEGLRKELEQEKLKFKDAANILGRLRAAGGSDSSDDFQLNHGNHTPPLSPPPIAGIPQFGQSQRARIASEYPTFVQHPPTIDDTLPRADTRRTTKFDFGDNSTPQSSSTSDARTMPFNPQIHCKDVFGDSFEPPISATVGGTITELNPQQSSTVAAGNLAASQVFSGNFDPVMTHEHDELANTEDSDSWVTSSRLSSGDKPKLSGENNMDTRSNLWNKGENTQPSILERGMFNTDGFQTAAEISPLLLETTDRAGSSTETSVNGRRMAKPVRKWKTSANNIVDSNAFAASTVRVSGDPLFNSINMPPAKSMDLKSAESLDEKTKQSTVNIGPAPSIPSGSSEFFNNFSAKIGSNLKLSEESNGAIHDMGPHIFTGFERPHVNGRTKGRTREPLASDFFDDFSTNVEVSSTPVEILDIKKSNGKEFPGTSAGSEVSHDLRGIVQSIQDNAAATTIPSSSQTATNGTDTRTAAIQSLPPDDSISPPPSENPKAPKDRTGRTQKRRALRKIANARARVEIISSVGGGKE